MDSRLHCCHSEINGQYNLPRHKHNEVQIVSPGIWRSHVMLCAGCESGVNVPQRCYFISGRVQGVWFRESTRRKASGLGLSGTATNLGDGRVRVLAEGPSTALAELEEWLQHGPPMATVNMVETESISFEPVDGFSIS